MTSRRTFLRNSLAASALGAFQFGRNPSAAKAEVATTMAIIAGVKAGISLAHSLGFFGDTSGGGGLRMESINMRLNQILRNQETLLKAISEVNQSVNEVKGHITNEFSKHRLVKLYDDSD